MMTTLEAPPSPAATFIPATAPRLVLQNSERQPCEVWTRVMGYHRPVSSFNVGKKGEHKERRFFREARCALA
jgi:hypothetical protein